MTVELDRTSLPQTIKSWQWDVQLLLPDGESWFTVAPCATPEAAGEVVRILLSARGGYQVDITIRARAS